MAASATSRRRSTEDPSRWSTKADIRDPAAVSDAIRDVDVCFHQAAIRITHVPGSGHAFDVLGGGAMNVLEAAVANGIRKVVAASSASVYGQAERFPTEEVTTVREHDDVRRA